MMLLHRLFPLIVVLSLALGIKFAQGADMAPQKPVPLVMPTSLLLPNWVLQHGLWGALREPEPPFVQIKAWEDLNEIDARCLECAQVETATLAALTLLTTLVGVWTLLQIVGLAGDMARWKRAKEATEGEFVPRS